MRRTPEKQALTDAENKAAILAASIDIFATEGFGGARIENVAKMANVSYGTVYRYYPTKEILYHMAVQHALEQVAVLHPEKEDTILLSPQELLSNVLTQTLKRAETEMGFKCLMLLSSTYTSTNVPEITRAYARESFLKLYNEMLLLASAAQEQVPNPVCSPEEIADIINALMIGFSFLRGSGLSKGVHSGTISSLLLQLSGGIV